ncbi:winged helix-turn-helix domain-containing protein [Streptomyces litmocidini]|uniref:Winged helix-turn-helix domain-containing protein n=1 Tax=Streptomyces litmocidini TaxID=67318 RepID=A0ABW7U340_9ACTN
MVRQTHAQAQPPAIAEARRWALARVAEPIHQPFGHRYTPRGGLYLLHRLSWSPQVPAHRAVEREEQAVARWRAEQRSRVRPCPMGWGGRWGRRGAGYVELDRPGRVVGDREAADPALSGAAAGWRDAGRT